jgi:hypothetical protein
MGRYTKTSAAIQKLRQMELQYWRVGRLPWYQKDPVPITPSRQSAQFERGQ